MFKLDRLPSSLGRRWCAVFGHAKPDVQTSVEQHPPKYHCWQYRVRLTCPRCGHSVTDVLAERRLDVLAPRAWLNAMNARLNQIIGECDG
mgnify:CR=1 FL=1